MTHLVNRPKGETPAPRRSIQDKMRQLTANASPGLLWVDVMKTATLHIDNLEAMIRQLKARS